MQNNKYPHSQSEILQNQEKRRKSEDANGDVWQDKRAKPSARIASAQPARIDIPIRAQLSSNKITRTKNTPNAKKAKEQLTLWIDPIVKSEVQRRAKSQGLSESEVGGALLKRGIQVDVDISYGALLTPVFENILKRYMTARDNRLAALLVRACISIEQTRSVSVNILGRHPKISPDVLNDILDHSLEDAKKKITRRSPELKELIKELNRWVVDEEKGSGE